METEYELSNNLLYNNLKSVTKLFRILEICIAVVFLSWTSTRLPFAVQISTDYLRQLLTVVISPVFTFLVCNAIVLTLFLKSGADHSPTSGSSIGTDNVDDDNAGFISLISDDLEHNDVVVYQDKETIYEERITATGDFDSAEMSKTEKNADVEVKKEMKRSESEKLMTETTNTDDRNLRRSETEKWRRKVPEETVYKVEELSNEEFQQTIETFIAKQIKFRQEEKVSIVVTGQSVAMPEPLRLILP